MFRAVLLVFGFLFVISCGEKGPALAGDAPMEIGDFMAVFPDISFPFKAADSNFVKLADSARISFTVFTTFIPDSSLKKEYGKNLERITIRPLGKIKKEKEIYLLAITSFNQKAKIHAFLFDDKNQFLSSLPLIEEGRKDGYTHAVSITNEPTFIISREKTDDKKQLLYTRTGYAYNSGSGEFISVLTDSNEDEKRNAEIINPIDTFPKQNKWSGDYIKNKRNFISVRDGSNPDKYIFFIHFEKNEGACIGELKGDMRIRDAKHAYYQESGDPCEIDLILEGSYLRVKERGNCGNHRGIRCFFDDSYRKKKDTKTPEKKAGRKQG